MNRTLLVAFLIGVSVAAQCFAADGGVRHGVNVVISEGSIQVENVELRVDPPAARRPYLSLEAAEKALSRAQDTYIAGVGVRVYAWRDLGVALQRGLRGVEKGKIFKFQVWFDDYNNKANHRHSGTFKGHVRLDGVDISPETTFDTIREELQKNGFAVGESSGLKYADKGEISLFAAGGGSDKIQRIEIWVRQ